MPELFNNVEYVSNSTASPFIVSLAAGANPADQGKRGFFIIRQASNATIYAEVEATLTGNSLAVDVLHRSSSADNTTPTGFAMPVFVGSVEIFSATPSAILGPNTSPGRDGVIILGQSNAVGYNGPGVDAGLSGFHPMFHQVDPNILQLCKGNDFVNPYDANWQSTARAILQDNALIDKYVVATEPLQHIQHTGGFPPTNSAGFGTEFAKIYRKESGSTRQIVLLPGAAGATGFTSAGTGKVWNAPSGTLYTNALALISQFMSENPDNRLVAILWHQGESNAATDTVEFQGYLDNFINSLRNNAVGNARQPTLEAVPFIIGGLSKTWIANGGANRQAIDDVLEDTVNRINYTGFADPAADYEVGTGIDDVHFGGQAHLRFARQYYNALLSARGNVVGISVPASPSGLNLSASDSQIQVTWNTVSGALTYTVEYKLTTSGTYITRSAIAGTTDTITGLTNGSAYDVRVFASNSAGDGAPSSALQATPEADTVPGSPTGVIATAGNAEATVSWTTVSHDPAVTGYIVRYRPTSGGAYSTQSTSQLNTTITGLTNGTEYEFGVAAINSVGTGAYSANETATPSAPTVAAAPTGLAATPGNAQVTLNWNTVTHDPVVTGYTIRYRIFGSSDAYSTQAASGQATTQAVITGLTNGTNYEFSIASVNSVGTGSYSADVAGQPTASSYPDTTALAPVLHLRRNTGVTDTTDAGRVEQWDDLSGNNLHLTQTVLVNKPGFANGDIDCTAVSTDEQWLQSGAAGLDLTTGNFVTAGYTFIIRYEDVLDIFANRSIINTDPAGPDFRVDGFGRFQYSPIDSGNTANLIQDITGGAGETGIQIRAVVHDATDIGTNGPNCSLYILNTGTAVLQETDDLPLPTVHTAFRVGTSIEAGDIDPMNGKIHDIIVFDKVLTTQQIQDVVAELETGI